LHIRYIQSVSRERGAVGFDGELGDAGRDFHLGVCRAPHRGDLPLDPLTQGFERAKIIAKYLDREIGLLFGMLT
jgi:hypothetical protein